MVSKTAFIFLMICLIAMINPGRNLICYRNCHDYNDSDCHDGQKNETCNATETYCIRDQRDYEEVRKCSDLTDCGIGCTPCQTDRCN